MAKKLTKQEIILPFVWWFAEAACKRLQDQNLPGIFISFPSIVSLHPQDDLMMCVSTFSWVTWPESETDFVGQVLDFQPRCSPSGASCSCPRP